MKEPDYVMKIMASGGALILDNNCKTVTRKLADGNGRAKQTKFQYTRPFDWHFWYHHIVDNHNNLHHLSPALEETWITKRWAFHIYFLTFNNWSEPVPCIEIFCMDKRQGKNQTWIFATNLLRNRLTMLFWSSRRQQWKRGGGCYATTTNIWMHQHMQGF